MKIQKLIYKIRIKLTHLRLQPIRVFCFHQTSNQYDGSVYGRPDWMPLAQLKDELLALQQGGWVFISLQKAQYHIANDWCRFRKYVVLTADDGLQCQAEILPWLEQHHIPITLFCNVKNLDGKTCGEAMLQYFHINDKESEAELAHKLYLNENQLMSLQSPMLSIANHGYEHVSATGMTLAQFEKNVESCIEYFKHYTNYVPFYAYTYGNHSMETDRVLIQKGITPVYIDGKKNYNDASCIHRELLVEKQ